MMGPGSGADNIYLGYVNRDTGVIEEPGHPLDGVAISHGADLPEGFSGSMCVLMGLIYTGKDPKPWQINCPLTLPACSLLGLPYGHGFDDDPCMAVFGDTVEFTRIEAGVQLKVVHRHEPAWSSPAGPFLVERLLEGHHVAVLDNFGGAPWPTFAPSSP